MKFLKLFVVIAFFHACAEKPYSKPKRFVFKDTILVRDTVIMYPPEKDWQQMLNLSHDPDVDTVAGKPVNYYLKDSSCSGLASDFYYGFLKPSDNGTTDELLKLACSPNSKLRPLYRWCLEVTISISDGALAEHVGDPARKYAELYPEEFFGYMDNDTSGRRYDDWVEAINYSGIYENEDHEKPKLVAANVVRNMKKNCKGCDSREMKRIEAFATHCFH